MEYLNDLNKEQRVAVEQTEGPSLVIASAGSGKTRVLTYRIAHLIEQGIPPYAVLALTFTNKAAREMKERIGKIVGEQEASRLWMGTFHAIFARILRYEAEHLGYSSNFTIYDANDARNAIKGIIKALNLDDKIYKPSVVSNRISAAKNNLITAAAYAGSSQLATIDREAKRPRTGEIYQIYSQKCKQADAMDFDDLLLQTNILFKRKPEVLAKYQKRFRYILVDEYQDTNSAQYLIVKSLAAEHRNVFVVGDDAQSIYSFRGAKIENILNFKKDYPEANMFKLEQNYRSTQNIVNAANCVISKNTQQFPKETFSENEEGEKVKVIKALTDAEEGFLVVKDLLHEHYTYHEKFSSFAILYRTNAQSRIFEEALRKKNIPYKIYGGLSFYQRKEIKDVLAYLRVLVNPKDEEALKRIINYPKRGIGDTTVAKLEELAMVHEVSLWQIIVSLQERSFGFNSGTAGKLIKFAQMMRSFQQQQETLSAYEIAYQLVMSVGIMSDLSADKSPEGVSRYENMRELLNGIQEFTELAQEEEQEAGLTAYLENVSLLSDLDSDQEEDNHVSLMTVHMAKGLEFDFVFIVGMEEKLFPSSMGGQMSQKNLEEERRLFYVALTRARKRAYISHAVTRYKWGTIHSEPASRFIQEIHQEYLENPLEATSAPSFSKATKLTRGGFNPQKKEAAETRFKKTNIPLPNIPNFEPSDVSEVKKGAKVLHSRFGEGQIENIEGEGQNKKAVVNFVHFGQKSLLLKFAKLKVLDS